MPDSRSLSEIVIAGYGLVHPYDQPWGEGSDTPVPLPPKPWQKHPRLRRTSPIAKYVVSAGLKALGHEDNPEAAAVAAPERLGVILCIQNGCVNFSKRFYGEVLDTPGFASPILFPETVFNSPASHLAAILGRTTINYTFIGDAAAFVQGLALATDWLREGTVDGALVIGAEEEDELTTAAYKIFHPDARVTCGAGAVYLRRQEDAPGAHSVVAGISSSHTFADLAGKEEAITLLTRELAELLSLSGLSRDNIVLVADAPFPALSDRRLSAQQNLGDGLSAAGAWQVVTACSQLERQEVILEKNGEWISQIQDFDAAIVPVIGAAEQAAGVLLLKSR